MFYYVTFIDLFSPNNWRASSLVSTVCPQRATWALVRAFPLCFFWWSKLVLFSLLSFMEHQHAVAYSVPASTKWIIYLRKYILKKSNVVTASLKAWLQIKGTVPSLWSHLLGQIRPCSVILMKYLAFHSLDKVKFYQQLENIYLYFNEQNHDTFVVLLSQHFMWRRQEQKIKTQPVRIVL